MKGKIVVMNKQCEIFIIHFSKNKVSFEREDDVISTTEVVVCKAFVSESIAQGELILLGNL